MAPVSLDAGGVWGLLIAGQLPVSAEDYLAAMVLPSVKVPGYPQLTLVGQVPRGFQASAGGFVPVQCRLGTGDRVEDQWRQGLGGPHLPSNWDDGD